MQEVSKRFSLILLEEKLRRTLHFAVIICTNSRKKNMEDVNWAVNEQWRPCPPLMAVIMRSKGSSPVSDVGNGAKIWTVGENGLRHLVKTCGSHKISENVGC